MDIFNHETFSDMQSISKFLNDFEFDSLIILYYIFRNRHRWYFAQHFIHNSTTFDVSCTYVRSHTADRLSTASHSVFIFKKSNITFGSVFARRFWPWSWSSQWIIFYSISKILKWFPTATFQHKPIQSAKKPIF